MPGSAPDVTDWRRWADIYHFPDFGFVTKINVYEEGPHSAHPRKASATLRIVCRFFRDRSPRQSVDTLMRLEPQAAQTKHFNLDRSRARASRRLASSCARAAVAPSSAARSDRIENARTSSRRRGRADRKRTDPPPPAAAKRRLSGASFW